MSDLREAVAQAAHQAAKEAGLRTGMVMGEYVVIVATNGFDEDGNEVSQTIVIPEDGRESRILRADPVRAAQARSGRARRGLMPATVCWCWGHWEPGPLWIVDIAARDCPAHRHA